MHVASASRHMQESGEKEKRERERELSAVSIISLADM
jgi:hypothetical protein